MREIKNLKEIIVIITDTHFGVKGNSQKWLSNQKNGFDEIYNYILEIKKDYDIINLVHCGDVFDNRCNINTMILYSARDILYKLAEVVNKFYILAGNHDYYSPNEEFKYINSLDLLLNHPNITLITDKYQLSKDEPIRKAFVPWYEFHKINEIIEDESPDVVFTHEDMFGFKPIDKNPIIAGHIHVPQSFKNCHNICSTFAMNFADANQTRGFYTFTDKLEYHPLKSICRFFNKHSNDDSFFDVSDIKKDDFVRLYVSNEHYQMERYLSKIDEYKELCDNINIIVHVEGTEIASDYSSGFKNINDIILEIVPDELKDKFEEIKNSI